jgi:tRNA-dihydrouridine synthase B
MNAIGKVILDNPSVLAPMAGITDLAFRLLAKEMGCGLVVSEMVSAKGLLYDNCRTKELLRIDPKEHPTAIQLFGSVPSELAEAARRVAAQGADIIDFNMGCPTPKIVKNGEGSALLRSPAVAATILQAMVAAVDIPVTVKIRTGWDAGSVNAVEVAKRLEQAGVSAIAVHGRTRDQFYAGRADWDIIRQVKLAVKIPVIGNGDVRCVQDAERLLTQSGCDGVMVGRAACGNVWIFRQLSIYLKEGRIIDAPDFVERAATLLRHLDMLIALKGEHIAIREMRRHASYYIKGYPRSTELRTHFNQANNRDDFVRILNEYKKGTTPCPLSLFQ